MPPRKITRTLPDRAARRNTTPSSSLTVEVPWPDETSDIDPEYEPGSDSSSGSEVELETESDMGDIETETEDDETEDDADETEDDADETDDDADETDEPKTA